MKYIRRLSETSGKDVQIAGGKGASLGEMRQSGILVPDGFIVTVDAFELFLKETGIQSFIETEFSKVDIQKVETVESASKKLRKLILGKQMPEEVLKEAMYAFDQLNTDYVAVRSSATAEDSNVTAWAGQLDSFLNTDKASLEEHIKRCWASLFTSRAILYRFEKSLEYESVLVAVVVQKMINSDISGTAFSVHPVTQQADQIVIEAGYGLGEAIVSGQITPDHYVVSKNTMSLKEKYVHPQDKKLVRNVLAAGNVWIEVPSALKKQQKLTDGEIATLTASILKIENHYGFPCDIEWAMEKGVLFIVQSRPITTLGNNQERVVMASHKSHLLTQDVILSGIFQYSTFSEFGTSFDYPYIRYENSTGNISYPFSQVDELRQSQLSLDEYRHLIATISLEIKRYKDFIEEFVSMISQEGDRMYIITAFFEATMRATKVIPYFAFEVGLENMLENHGITQDMIPSTQTQTSNSSKELYKMASIYKADLTQGVISPGLQLALVRFCETYGYLGMQYFGGTPWDQTMVYDLLVSMKDNTMLEAEKSVVFSDHPLSLVAGELLAARTENWESMCKACSIFRRFIKEKCSDILDYEQILGLRVDDVLRVMQGKEPQNKVKVTKDPFMLEIRNNGVFLEDEPISENIPVTFDSVLRGATAQVGVVQGVVKVVLSPEENYKVDQGDILVAVMSTPDYLPAMHKAAAFITDIGGITSHAAIVAREMQKPCVIGTAIATKVLFDGDLVLVDATNGLIYKL